jgi:hypothetical protein
VAPPRAPPPSADEARNAIDRRAGLTRHRSPDKTLAMASAMTDDRDYRPQWADALVITETEDGLEVTQPDSGRMHELTLTATLVFELCSGERSVAAIVEVVQAAFELAEPPTAEVLECLDHLRREGVVV